MQACNSRNIHTQKFQHGIIDFTTREYGSRGEGNNYLERVASVVVPAGDVLIPKLRAKSNLQAASHQQYATGSDASLSLLSRQPNFHCFID